jgi:hypothetical protein
MRAYLGVMIVLGAAPVAAAPPVTLRGQVLDGRNLHIANQGGAIHWSADIRITVELAADHTLTAQLVGNRSEHNLYADHGGASYNTDETTTWTADWRGTWRPQGAALALELTALAHTCQHARTSDRFAPETLPCRDPAPTAHLRCAPLKVTMVDPDTSRRVEAAAWSCGVAADDPALGESPPTWALGKTGCVAALVSGGFRTCAP